MWTAQLHNFGKQLQNYWNQKRYKLEQLKCNRINSTFCQIAKKLRRICGHFATKNIPVFNV
jgi:hypothetical protein